MQRRNAFAAYERLLQWNPTRRADLLEAHGILMNGLVDRPGRFRSGAVGVTQGERVIHIAPPAARVAALVDDLLAWLEEVAVHPLVRSCVFHYEFEFIHPFADGNGRMGRLWQTLILAHWNPLMAWLPVESVIRERQAGYYEVLGLCDRAGESTAFIEFMLEAVDAALQDLPEANPATDQVTDQVRRLLRALGSRELSATELMDKLGMAHRPTFRGSYLKPALDAGLVELTDPASPRSPRQRYRRTGLGAAVAKKG